MYFKMEILFLSFYIQIILNPAVSHNCNLIELSSSFIVFVIKSIPIVDYKYYLLLLFNLFLIALKI